MLWIRIAASLGALGVACGAFGAHALRNQLSERMLNAWQTGVLYHLIHALALLSLALYARAASHAIATPAVLFTAGIVLFSGSLYAMALTGVTKLGAITPFGGLCLIAGWIAVGVSVARAT